jgi:hypothetical protein
MDRMNLRTNLHAGQDGTLNVDQVAALVKQLDCQISPLEMLSIGKKYCKNFNLGTISQLTQMAGGAGGSSIMSLLGG